jgi:hypothetical protein
LFKFVAMKSNKLAKLIMGLLLGVIIGAITGYLVFAFMAPNEAVSHPWHVKLGLVPITIFTLLFTIAWHEWGHVLAGLSQNFEFRLISVGPLMLEKELGKLKFKWNTNFNLYGGLALCLPTNQNQLIKRFAVFAAGGPLASLLLGVLMMLFLIWKPLDTSVVFLYYLKSFIFLTCVTSFCIALMTSIPMQADGFTTDGGRILNLLKGGPAAQVEAALLHAVSQGASGIRPALIDPTPIHSALDLPVDSPFKPYLNAILYQHYQDKGDLENAGKFLEQYLAGAHAVPQGYLAILYLEKAWFEARYHNQAAVARDYFSREKIGVIVPKSLVLRAEAAIALAEGNHALAATKIQEAIDELPKLMDRGAAIAEKESLEEMRARCLVG